MCTETYIDFKTFMNIFCVTVDKSEDIIKRIIGERRTR